MKRSQIVEKLINEGFSEKTLVKFNDKQLNDLSVRIFGEATKMIPKEKTAEITAGDGLTRVGSTISAVGTASRVTVSGAGIDIASTYVGQATITTLGTITTGTWSGTVIGLTKGGTGADLSALSSGTLIKKAAGATLTSAVVDTDYLSPSSIIDGGTF